MDKPLTNEPTADESTIQQDTQQLQELGYSQELARRMGGFSNLALSMSIICILAGGITSFHVGYCSVGGAAIGLGWPLACLFSLCVAATMAQLASAFPTAGGLYHWAAILGGRGWGWITAWCNLIGLITVLAAINVGTYEFALGAFFPGVQNQVALQVACVFAITGTQALVNYLGIHLTTRLTDISGYLILSVAALLTLSLLWYAPQWPWARLATFSNYSALPADGPVWPRVESIAWLFALGLLLPAYTITGFDASAHVAEETIAASHRVPRGILRSVLVSGVFGWAMLAAIVLAMPDPEAGARQGRNAVLWTLRANLPPGLERALVGGIVISQYLCGLATVTSASRMLYAFARDGGPPFSFWLRKVHSRLRTPGPAIGAAAASAWLFTLYTPVYVTITAVCTIFLYLSYVLPTALGMFAHGRRWTHFGPWQLGAWFKPLSLISIVGCGLLLVIGVQPPNSQALIVVAGVLGLLGLYWRFLARGEFQGPPKIPALTRPSAALAVSQPRHSDGSNR